MSVAYLDIPGFKNLTAMPASDVDLLDSGYVNAQLLAVSSWIDSQLAKRYATPFASPYPITVQFWLARIVTSRLYVHRGVNSTDAEIQLIKEDADDAKKEIAQAADAQNGLYELPLRSDTDSDGVVRGGPSVYSEASPYVRTTIQGNIGRNEDQNGGGTFG